MRIYPREDLICSFILTLSDQAVANRLIEASLSEVGVDVLNPKPSDLTMHSIYTLLGVDDVVSGKRMVHYIDSVLEGITSDLPQEDKIDSIRELREEIRVLKAGKLA